MERNPRSGFRVGYACLNPDVPNIYKTCRQSNLTLEKWHDLIEGNLETLGAMVRYNRKHKLSLYRISSDLIPFGSADVLAYDWAKDFAPVFEKLKALLGRIRFSMHPGQYTVLNSPDPNVVRNAIKDLEYHVRVMELLGATRQNKLVLHIGGVYGDKPAAMDRFAEAASRLDQRIRDHLIIENDERLYTIADVLWISERTGLPVIFDNLHHQINPPPEACSMAQWITRAGATWQEEDGRQIIHYSEQARGKRPGAHSVTVDSRSFLQFIDTLDQPLDIMLEVKDKNRSAEKLQMILQGDVKLAETLWARHKYSVLAKSQPIYREIRMLLKQKDQADLERVAQLFEQAQTLPHSPGDAVNAAEHVWGYFKKQATAKEKDTFRQMLEAGVPDEPSEMKIRSYLKKILKKYPNTYLESSYYFNETPPGQADQ